MTFPPAILTRVRSRLSRASTAFAALGHGDHAMFKHRSVEVAQTVPRNVPQAVTNRAPNFLVIGAGKAGTTSLWHQLEQHPQIFMHASKKLNYFAFEGDKHQYLGPPPLQTEQYAIRRWDDYLREFRNVKDELAVGEACNAYLYSPSAARRIRESIPDAKLIAVLRHPVERGYARFLQLRASGRETIPKFEDALLAEDQRVAANWWPEFHYLRAGLYHEQLRRYLDVFPAAQIRIHLHCDMVRDQAFVLKDIYRFLGVRDDFLPNTEIRYNPTGIPKNKSVDWLLRTLKHARPAAQRMLSRRQVEYLLKLGINAHTQNLLKPKLSPEARQWMIARYRDDTLRLQDLLNRDLSSWLV